MTTAIANFGPREYLPTPPPALIFESGTCLPLRGARLPRDDTYLPSRRFFQLQWSPACPGKETQPWAAGCFV